MEQETVDRELLKALNSDSRSGMTIQDVLSFVWRLKWWIAAFLVVSLIVSFFYVKLQIPTYQCAGKVMFIDDRSGSTELSILAEVTGKGQNRSALDDEIIIIKSPSLMTQVVEELGLNIRYYQYRLPVFHTSFPLFRSMLNLKEYEFYNDAPFEMVMDFDKYYSESSRPESLVLKFEALGGDRYEIHEAFIGGGSVSFKGDEIHIFGDTLVFQGVNVCLNTRESGRLIPGDVYKVEYCSPYILGEQLSSNLSVSLDNGIASHLTNIMTLFITDTKPQRGVDILNSLVKEYNFQSREFKSQTAVKSIEFINERLAAISNDLGSVETEYKNYQISNNYLDGAGSGVASTSDAFEQELNALNLQRTFLSFIKEDVKGIGEGNYKVISSNVGLEDGVLSRLINEYNALVLERERLAVNSTSNNPAVLKYNEKLSIAFDNVEAGVMALDRVFETRRKELENTMKDVQRQRSFIPARELDLSQISRKQQIIEPLYIQLNQKKEEMQLSMFTVTDNVRVIEAARCNMVPLSPNEKKIYMMAILIGLLIPIGSVFLRNILRGKVETKEDVKKYVDNPILATIPKGDGTLISSYGRDPSTESFRMLRSNLQYFQGKVIQLTSSISGEGKSYIAANLAISLSHLQKKVALVGLDLRKPVLEKLFPGVFTKESHSVVGYLIGKNNDVGIIGVPCEREDSSLDIYFSGKLPPNPTELLARGRLETLIEYLRMHYDYVILDTAPFMPVSDALIVNKYADLTLYVVRSDYTPLKMLQDIGEVVESGRLKNVGIVVNGMDMSARKYRYGYGYGYGYGRGYGYGKGYGYGYGYGYGFDEKKS